MSGHVITVYDDEGGFNDFSRKEIADLMREAVKLRARVAELEAKQPVADGVARVIERLLWASQHCGESGYCGEDDPWSDARALLAAQQQKDGGV